MIYVSTPIWRYYDVRAAHSLTSAIAMNDTKEPVLWETIDGDALIERSRSILATKFYNGIEHPETGEVADIMVILDDDVQFDPKDLWSIVAQARERQEPVGGIYVTRSRKPHLASRLLPDQPFVFGKSGTVEVEYLATGFMAVPRVCVQRMVEIGMRDGFETRLHDGQRHYIDLCELGVGDLPCYDVFGTYKIDDRVKPGHVHRLSEDWAFCENLRQCGYKIWADQSIILSHRAYVSITCYDLPEAEGGGTMLSEEGAPAQGSSILVVDDRTDAERESVIGSESRSLQGATK